MSTRLTNPFVTEAGDPSRRYLPEAGGEGGSGEAGGGSGGDGGQGQGQQSSGDQSGEVDWKAKAREWERRANGDARKLTTLQGEIENLKTAQLSESDKAIKKAREEGLGEGRKAALMEANARVVKATMRGLLTGRHGDPDTLLAAVDHSAFLSGDGEPDEARIKEWIDRVAPAQQQGGAARLDLGQGRRDSGGKGASFNEMIRAGARR